MATAVADGSATPATLPTAAAPATSAPEAVGVSPSPSIATDPPAEPTPAPHREEFAPIQVDFPALQKVNRQVVAWLYCPDTPIHYAVCHGTDDEYYLDHGFDRSPRYGGAIFLEAANREGFVDANLIVYGHHMRDGSMFTCLDNWQDQSFYEAHSCMYLLTPEGDYRVDLVSACTVAGDGPAYTVFYGHGQAFSEYLSELLAASDFVPLVEPDENAQYLLLSTCNKAFEQARYVLLGMLVPLDSVGGYH